MIRQNRIIKAVLMYTLLPNGDRMIVESGVGRIIHVNQAGKITKEFPLKKGAHNTRWARMTDKGGNVVASEKFSVVEYAAAGNTL